MQETPEIDEPEAPGLGAIFTKPWVVDLILDLVGYRINENITDGTLVEPSVGHGAFVVAAVRRLAQSAKLRGIDVRSLENAIYGVDIDASAVAVCRKGVVQALRDQGVAAQDANRLAQAWIHQGDFLLADDVPQAAWVVGNPPYVRVEDVPRDLMQRYRARWTAMSGRADLYVGFIEASIAALKPGGVLGTICADRWMRNQYGKALRQLIVESCAMEVCIVMHETEAFEAKVLAYPAITVVRRAAQQSVLMSCPPGSFQEADASDIVRTFDVGEADPETALRLNLAWATTWYRTSEGWPDANPAQIAFISKLEAQFPTLEEAGVRISVGVATGLDRVYAIKDPMDIEPERLLKFVSARETASGHIEWAGRYLVNPWDASGLVDLDDWPQMKAHLEAHRGAVENRHVALNNPDKWWRTLDRVHPSVAGQPKLLVPDLKDRIFPVLDTGEYCASHSLYILTSDSWDLEVLGGLLMSETATAFVEAYSVRMANGYLRVSAQYLRKVRVPDYAALNDNLRTQLRTAFRDRDFTAASRWARIAYGEGGSNVEAS